MPRAGKSVEERREIAVDLLAGYLSGEKRKDTAKRIGISKTVATVISVEFNLPSTGDPHVRDCLHCGVTFQYSPSTNKRYCSYSCHIKSGGAKRAGEAAVVAKRKYGAKKDANHKEVMAAIRVHAPAHDFSDVGCGVPDGIAWVNDGWHFFDIKNPKTAYGRRGLNPRQKDWAQEWRGGPVYLIYTVEEGLMFGRGEFDGIKKFPDQEDDGL